MLHEVDDEVDELLLSVAVIVDDADDLESHLVYIELHIVYDEVDDEVDIVIGDLDNDDDDIEELPIIIQHLRIDELIAELDEVEVRHHTELVELDE